MQAGSSSHCNFSTWNHFRAGRPGGDRNLCLCGCHGTELHKSLVKRIQKMLGRSRRSNFLEISNLWLSILNPAINHSSILAKKTICYLIHLPNVFMTLQDLRLEAKLTWQSWTYFQDRLMIKLQSYPPFTRIFTCRSTDLLRCHVYDYFAASKMVWKCAKDHTLRFLCPYLWPLHSDNS